MARYNKQALIDALKEKAADIAAASAEYNQTFDQSLVDWKIAAHTAVQKAINEYDGHGYFQHNIPSAPQLRREDPTPIGSLAKAIMELGLMEGDFVDLPNKNNILGQL